VCDLRCRGIGVGQEKRHDTSGGDHRSDVGVELVGFKGLGVWFRVVVGGQVAHLGRRQRRRRGEAAPTASSPAESAVPRRARISGS